MKGIAIGLLIAVGFALACAPGGDVARRSVIERNDKMQEINTLWAQIRDWRSEAGWALEPPASMLFAIKDKSVGEAKKVCPENFKPPAKCDDTCRLSGSICENAELICKIAESLKGEDRAQQKCTSAKASCREAKQMCCSCSTKPPMVVDPPATPTEPKKP